MGRSNVYIISSFFLIEKFNRYASLFDDKCALVDNEYV